MYVGLKQPRGDGERYVTPARAAAKETTSVLDRPDMLFACLFYRESPGSRIVSTQGVLTSWAAIVVSVFGFFTCTFLRFHSLSSSRLLRVSAHFRDEK